MPLDPTILLHSKKENVQPFPAMENATNDNFTKPSEKMMANFTAVRNAVHAV